MCGQSSLSVLSYIVSFIFPFLSPFQALKLVEEETRRYRPTKNYLDYLPAPPDAVFLVSTVKGTIFAGQKFANA